MKKISNQIYKIKRELKRICNKIFKTNFPIHKNVFIGKNVKYDKTVVLGGDLKIGDESYIRAYSEIGSCVEIGKYCSIANNVIIAPPEHDYSKFSTRWDNKPNKITIIENDVWIGTQSIILQGVKIGNGAIVGANSVVTKDIPPYAIVVGSPAKILKFRFNNETIQKLLSLKWWNLPPNEIEKMKKSSLQNILQ